MPSKGVKVYSYLAVEGCHIEFSVPGHSVIHNQQKNWSSDHLEVESSKISPWWKYEGKFSFTVFKHGKEIANQWNMISSLTGQLGDGSMTAIKNTPSIITAGVIISYGFYDAGTGEFGLPRQDQCYVTVTPAADDWMGKVAAPGSSEADKPFTRFVLPAPHDVGMNSTQSSDLVIHSQAIDWIAARLLAIPGGVVFSGLIKLGISSGLVGKIIYGIAMTQKDSLPDMLSIGARYFEFRPARLPDDVRKLCGLDDKNYFMHACIPGLAYNEFLYVVLDFLLHHPNEIVVVQLRSDGIIDQCPKPSAEETKKILDEAMQRIPGVGVGDLNDMQTLSVRQLREQNKRLIVLPRIEQYSSYDDTKYSTLNGDSIITALDGMSTDGQAGKPFTLLQCQATATNDSAALKYSVLTSNASTSLLTSTKAICDTKTNPWLRDNVMNKMAAEQLVVVMNDWIEGATVDVSIDLSNQRFAK